MTNCKNVRSQTNIAPVGDCEKDNNLTEKWKKGQLESFRWYYVKFKTGEIDICWLTEWSNDELGTGGQYFDGIEEENILEIIAPVPSYKELQNMNKAVNQAMSANIKLVEQNKQLKERLEKQYDRAKWWLNEIVKNHRFTPISTAEKALKDLEELEKCEK